MGMSRILIFLLLPFLAGAAEIDILDLLHGASAKNMEGAQGSWERSGKVVKFIKTAAPGYMIYAGNSKFDPAITPGKTYEAVADFEIKGDATGALMLSMPGGKRRPFPIRVLKDSGKAVITFTARPDEKQVHFHAVVRGRGEVTLKSMTLKEISHSLGYNYRYISGIVNKIYKVPFPTIINSHRIHRACAFLDNGEKSITEISMLCGFGSTRSFNRNFKQTMGATPQSYRKSGFATA